MDNVKYLSEMAEKGAPELWKACYPRIYDGLGNFNSPKIAACSLYNSIITPMHFGLDGAGVKNMYAATALCTSHDVPTFFVSKSLIQALNQTDLPDDLRWTEINMPHPGMLFVFEKGAIKHPTAGEIAFGVLARMKEGITIKGKFPNAPIVDSQSNGMIAFTGAHESPQFDQFDITLGDHSSPTIKDIAYVRDEKYDREPDGLLSGALTVDDRNFNHFILILMIKIVLVMNERPALVESGKLLRSVRDRKSDTTRSLKEFWSPNIIGRNYKISIEQPANNEPGRHVRWHWRRGHWTNQPHGPKNSLRKRLWREPVMVGELTAESKK